MRTTTRTKWRFTFGISDVGRLLGKSPRTLRQWDEGGFVSFDRTPGAGDRYATTQGIRTILDIARAHNRITVNRFNLVCATMTLIEEIEESNDRKVKR